MYLNFWGNDNDKKIVLKFWFYRGRMTKGEKREYYSNLIDIILQRLRYYFFKESNLNSYCLND